MHRDTWATFHQNFMRGKLLHLLLPISSTNDMDEETLNATPTVHGRSAIVRIDDDFDEESPEAIDSLEIFGWCPAKVCYLYTMTAAALPTNLAPFFSSYSNLLPFL